MTAQLSATIEVAIRRLPHAEALPLPDYATDGSAGMDLVAAVGVDVVLDPGAWQLIPTGLCLELPGFVEAQVRPRSGLALRHAVTVLNSPGTIDSDYRGEVGVILINHGPKPFTIRRGDRIAQLVIAPVMRCEWRTAVQLTESDRGAGGFGSTGQAIAGAG